MPTIYDIALEAQVSPSTVSRALKGSRLVSDEVRREVERVATRLGFERRTVRRHRGRVILNIRLVLPRHAEPERGLFFDFSELVRGLNEGLSPSASNIVCESGGQGYVPFPHKKGRDTDGFVFAFHRPDPEVLEQVAERGIPVVVLNRSVMGTLSLISNHAAGMEDLVGHVFDHTEHLKPLFVGLEGLDEVQQARLDGWKNALAKRGIEIDPERQVVVFEMLDRINSLAVIAMSGRANAIFCVNDIVAAAVLAELTRAGVRVPEDCQVTGFDDSPVRRLTRPLLTTVSMPIHELAMQAGQRLSSAIIDSVSSPDLISLSGLLKVGESTRNHHS